MSALATLRPPAYTLSAVLASVHGATFTRTASGELRTRCPWHDDHRPSLRVNDAKGVAFCDACGAGGNAYAVLLPVLGSSSAVAAFLRDVAPTLPSPRLRRTGTPSTDEPRARSGRRASVIEAVYPYWGLTYSDLRYLKLRYRPKTFALWHLEAGGRFVPGMGGRAPVLYGLPLLAEWRPSYCLVVEGERDAMRAWDVGIPATCNFDGAGPGKWREGYGFALASLGVRRVYAIPDHDSAGRAHAKAVVASCRATGLPAWYVPLPGVPPKGDLSDFLDLGHSAADVRRLLPTWESA